jgi:protoheme IX farnesyltransferase
VTDVPPARGRSTLDDLVALIKVRLNTLVVATTAGGYYMASADDLDVMHLMLTCVGTALVAGGASALNQVDERDTDRLMARTRGRPVADGRMPPARGRAIALAFSVAGLIVLWFWSAPAAALVAAATLVSYVLIYTPLKRRTPLATVVGAVPGALPPLIGWAAAGGVLTTPAPWSLFFLMFLWQLPHFLAIAWIYREDYLRAGLPMLPVVDSGGAMTGRQAVLWAAALVPVSTVPVLIGLTGATYGLAALVLGVAQLGIAFRFMLQRTDARARALFFTSIVYLPVLWIAMAIGRA